MEPEGYHSIDPSVGHFFPTRNIAIPLSGSRFQSEDQWVTTHVLKLPSSEKNARKRPPLSTLKKFAPITVLNLPVKYWVAYVDKLGDSAANRTKLNGCTAIYDRSVKFFLRRFVTM
jgi:hypothetical protein